MSETPVKISSNIAIAITYFFAIVVPMMKDMNQRNVREIAEINGLVRQHYQQIFYDYLVENLIRLIIAKQKILKNLRFMNVSETFVRFGSIPLNDVYVAVKKGLQLLGTSQNRSFDKAFLGDTIKHQWHRYIPQRNLAKQLQKYYKILSISFVMPFLNMY